MAGVLLEARPYRPFKSSEEYLYAMKEDLAEWLNMLYSDLEINVDNFMDKLETGVVLCKHANSVKKSAEEYVARKHLRRMTSSQALTASLMTKTALPITKMGEIIYRLSAKPGTFFARDNVSNFIDFCRHGLEIIECLLFETDDLIMRKNEKNVILCLLEVARRGAKFGMLAPILVQMEREIDREIAAEQRLVSGDADEESSDEECVQYGPIPQIITNDLKSLDEMVRDLVEKCTCPTQFPMIRVSEGKYRIGDTKVLIFVRILRSHVMVRVGGGWDTLSHYLDKHDPCRCRTGHKAALSSKLILKSTGAIELNNAQVLYERSPPRTRRSSASSSSSGVGGRDARDLLSCYSNIANRSRSPTPKRDNAKGGLYPQKYIATYNMKNGRQGSVSPKRGRSVSPGIQNGPRYNAPTTASQNRSRSPSVQSPEKSKKKQSEYHAKQNDIKYLTITPLSEVEKQRTQRAKVKLEADPINNSEDNKQNDSESEVSDEGYRSLGLVVTAPLIGEGKVVVNDKETQKDTISVNSAADDSDQRESPTSEYSFPSNDDDNHVESTKTKKTSLKTQKPIKKASTPNSQGVPAKSYASPTPARRFSHFNDSDSFRRQSNKENELKKTQRSRSATSKRSSSVEAPFVPKNVKSHLESEKYGTWNGKSRNRPNLQSDTSSNFVRNGVGRSSLGARTASYDPSTGRRITAHKEQKNISPLLADLLKTEDLNDDKTILTKMREIINQYSGIFESSSDKKYDSDAEDLDFTSDWVRNDVSFGTTESIDPEDKSSPNKRKDSKYDGTHSKIPAPVFFKTHLSEKEC